MIAKLSKDDKLILIIMYAVEQQIRTLSDRFEI